MANLPPRRDMSPLSAALFSLANDAIAAELRVYERTGVTEQSRIQACREVGKIERLYQPSIEAIFRQGGDNGNS